MRITQQMLAQMNTVSPSSKVKADGTVDLKALVGKSLEGRLFAIQANGIAMFATGDTVLTVDLAGTQAFENQAATLKVTGVTDGVLTARVITDVPSEMSSPMSDLLSKLGVNDSPENRAILNAMKDAGLPLSKEVFSAMRQGVLEVKIIQSEIHQMSDVALSNEIETPLKQLAIKLIQGSQASNNQAIASQNMTTQTTQTTPANQVNQVNQVNMEASGQVALSTASVTDTLASLVENNQSIYSEVEALTPQEPEQTVEKDAVSTEAKGESSKVLAEAIKNTFPEATLKDSVKQLLLAFDLPQESLLIKNEMPLSLKNLFLAYDLLTDGQGAGKRFENLLTQMDGLRLDKSELETLVKMLSSDRSELEKLQELADWAKKTMPDSEVASGLEREVAVIKESMTLTRPLNDQLFYMQMPIKIDERLEQVEIYYKRNKKKVDPDDITLLVALDTKHVGEVRCLINKVKNHFTLHFTFENEEIMKRFKDASDKLEKALGGFDDRAFSIKFSVKSEGEADFDTFPVSHFGFDYKV
jgi:hypothetical protein